MLFQCLTILKWRNNINSITPILKIIKSLLNIRCMYLHIVNVLNFELKIMTHFIHSIYLVKVKIPIIVFLSSSITKALSNKDDHSG